MDPAAADYGQVLTERLDQKRFPTMAQLTTDATFDNNEGDVAPRSHSTTPAGSGNSPSTSLR